MTPEEFEKWTWAVVPALIMLILLFGGNRK